MSVAGSTSSQGTHSRSPSRSRSPPYSDGRYPPSSSGSRGYSTRYDSYNYGRGRNNMSAALDDYRDLRDRERDREIDRERDRSRGLMRDYMSPRGRERDRDDRYPPYYRDDPPHYPSSSSSSNIMPRDYSKLSTSNLRRDEQSKDPNKMPASSSSNSIKDLKDGDPTKPPNTPTSADPYAPSSRYVDWRDRERERRYREDRHYDDRRRDGYRRYESSSYGGPPPPINYQISPYGGGDSYRPDRDRDRDIPPSPSSHMPYYERDRLDERDRDYYRGGRGSGPSGPGGSGPSGPGGSGSNPMSDYDRYRGSGSGGRGGGRPTWGESRRMDRDHRPGRIITDRENSLVRSGRNSPISASYPSSARDRTEFLPKSAVDEKKEEDRQQHNEDDSNSPSVEKTSTMNSPEPVSATTTEGLETGEVVEEEMETKIAATTTSTQPSTTTSPIVEKKIELPTPATQVDNIEEKKEAPPEPITTNKEEPVIVKNEQDSSDVSLPPPPPPPAPVASSQMEQGEVIEEEVESQPAATLPITSTMTQEEIVGRISDIENQISQNEELLEAAIKREEEAAARATLLEQQQQQQQAAIAVEDEDVEMADDEDETAEDEAAQNKEEAKKQALQAMDNEPTSSSSMMDFTNDNVASSPVMRKRPQLLINQLRSKIDDEDDKLYEKILSDNRKVAKENSMMIGGWQGGVEDEDDWSDEEKWKKPLYANIEDYPCYQDNIAKFEQLRISVTHALATQKVALEKKERYLKGEYKRLYGEWKEKNLALDRMRDSERRGPEKFGTHRMSSRRLNQQQEQQQNEEYTDGVIFTANKADALRFSNGGTSTPYAGNGLYTSDAARSEAELLEIIQSLESAEMRNPESRAKKTTATIPPMILDVRERMRTYDDRSGLVEDPLNYYHTGPNFGDTWNQEEVTTFMESYMVYPKQFERISRAVGTKTACQCVLFYYRKKKKIDFKALMKKGRRGKTNKHRDRIAAAIRLATGDSSSNGGRKTKSKGSALMQDIGEAQNSRKAKEKDAERKNRELRDLESANAYWDGVNERKKTKRPSNQVSVPPISTPIVQSGPPSSASDDTDMMLTTNVIPPQPSQQDKRRANSGSGTSAAQQRRANKGRSPRESIQSTTTPAEPVLVLPSGGGATKRYTEDISMDTATTTGDEDDDKTLSGGASGVAKWSGLEKDKAIEAFKEHGRDFVQVSGLVQTKTEEQCRNFYHNYKRKNGPNAFNEEDARNGGQDAPIATPTTASTAPIIAPPTTAEVHNEVVAVIGRTDLKAEEEDAAAALVGMFQMGANSTPREESNKPLGGITSRSRTPSGHEDIIFPTGSNPTPTSATATTVVTPPLSSSTVISSQQQQQQQQKGRRRVRSSSSRAESVTADDTTEWADPDYGSKSGGRKLGRTTSLADAKRPAYSSYWSVSEKNDFQNYLSMYGRDWEKLANAMKSKTVIQVRNFYANNEEKMQLKEVVDKYQSSRQQTPQQEPSRHSNDMPLMGTSFDTSAAHFQALQNFPFPLPIIDQPVAEPSVRKYPSPSAPTAAAAISTIPPPPSQRSRIYSHSPQPPPPQQQPVEVYNNTPISRNTYSTSSTPHNINSQQLPPQPQPQQQPQVQPSKNRTLEALMESPVPSAVTKVADLLNNDDPAEPNQNSWETWFGS